MKHTRRTLSRRPLAARTVTDPDTGRSYVVPAGGADDGDRLEQLVARIGSDSQPLTDEELAEAERRAVESFDDADGDDPDVEAMEELANAIGSIREEQDTREQAADERRIQAASLRDTIHASDEDDEDSDADAATGEADDDAEASDEDDDVDTTDVPDDASSITDADDREPITAAAQTPPARPSLGAAARRRRRSSQPTPRRGNLTVVTAGDVPGMSAGTLLDSLDQVGQAFARKADAVMKGGSRGRFGVASFEVQYPEDRQLDGDAQRNEERVDAVIASAREQSADAIIAAGGLCAPVDVAYDLDGVSVESRPIRDSLTRFGADRGGIRFVSPPSLSDLSDSVGVWTETIDGRQGTVIPDSEPPATYDESKAMYTITCGEEVEVLVDAITRGLRVGNFSRRTFPEQFARFWQLSGAAHSRLAEQTLWDRMVAEATAVTAPKVLGAARDILSTLDQVVAAARSRHRMGDGASVRVILPSWVRELIRVDLTRQLAGDSTTALTGAQIDAHFAARSVVVTYSPDVQVFGPQSAGELNAFPGTVEMLAFPEGSFVFLDGGTLDFGMEVRDAALNAKNDVEAFVETFENVAFRGIEALHITSTVSPTGEARGTLDVV